MHLSLPRISILPRDLLLQGIKTVKPWTLDVLLSTLALKVKWGPTGSTVRIFKATHLLLPWFDLLNKCSIRLRTLPVANNINLGYHCHHNRELLAALVFDLHSSIQKWRDTPWKILTYLYANVIGQHRCIAKVTGPTRLLLISTLVFFLLVLFVWKNLYCDK